MRVRFAILLSALSACALTSGPALAESGSVLAVHGADPGAPLMRRFASVELGGHPGNLDVLADPAGVVYAGNYEGLLRYASGQFHMLALPGAAPARALALGRDGRLYVASYDHFGVVEISAEGELEYQDLRRAFALEGREAFLGSVWSVHALDDAVYFHAREQLYRYAYDGKAARFDLPSQTRAFHDDGRRLYTRVEGRGMVQFLDGSLLPVPGGELFASRPLDLVIAQPDGTLLLVSREGGFFQADETGIKTRPNPFADLLVRHVPYAHARLHDGSLALGTLSGELLLLDAELAPQQRYKIGVYAVTGLSVDAEHGLWAATEGGLLRLQLPSPWTAIAADDGLPGQVVATAWHEGILWVAGASGLCRSRTSALGDSRMTPHAPFQKEVWDLAVTPAGLLAVSGDGLHRVTENGSEAVLALAEPHLMAQPEVRSGRVFIASEDTLWVVDADTDAISLLQELKLDGLSVSALQAVSDEELWIGDYRGGPWRLRLGDDGREVRELRRFDAADGADIDAEHGSIVLKLDGSLHVLTGTRVFAWDGRRFHSTDADGLAALLDREGELVLAESPHGTFALTSRALYQRTAPGAGWQRMRIDSPLARGFVDMDFSVDGVLRVITWNGILQYRPGIAEPPLPPLKAALRSVGATLPGAEELRLPLQPSQAQQLPPGASPVFSFELRSSEPQPCFRTRLLGAERTWSACTDRSGREFVALPPGAYRFEVQGQTPVGRQSDIAGWDFEVLPRWYETWWTRIAAAVGLLLLVLLIAAALSRRRHRILASSNRELEARIAERTAALEEANRRLNQLATEDSLTGVANRRALDQGLSREWLRCADRRLPFSVLMMDVDHFKSYNDRYGHLEGDRLLRRLAEHLAARTDPQRELLARYGGEEFVLVLPDCTLEAACARAEALRTSIDGRGLPVTLSIGVASETPTHDGAPSQLVRRADNALYRAKERGRNRVERAD